MSHNGSSQLLDGSPNARIVLKTFMDKTIVTKLPVTGQINELGQEETDLQAGDLIKARIDVPRQNSVDIYCHAQSVRLAGVGESAFWPTQGLIDLQHDVARGKEEIYWDRSS